MENVHSLTQTTHWYTMALEISAIVRILRTLAVRSALFASLCAPVVTEAWAQSAPNHRLSIETRLPDSLHESHAGGRYRMIISRSATSPFERELIRIAELVLPDSSVYTDLSLTPESRREFERAASGVAREVSFARPAEPRVAGESAERWWFLDFDGTFTPLSLTSGAVSYYIGRFRDIAQGLGQFRQPGEDGPDRLEFSYRARVMSTTEHNAHRVVELSMNWNYWCSTLCGMSFSYKRRVFFDTEGRVVHVDGDGPAKVSVS